MQQNFKSSKIPLLGSDSLQNFEQKTAEIPHFYFSLSCRIASVTSYLRENEAKYLQNADIHLAQIPDFGMGYIENHLAHWGQWWPVFCIFHAL